MTLATLPISPPHVVTRWAPLLMAGALWLLALLTPRMVAAQEQDPLRMVVLNVAEQGGSQPRDAIVEILEGNEAIELIASEDVRSIMENQFGVNEKILRQSELREKFRNRLLRLNTSRHIEGMLLIDVYNKGRTLQVVVIGPEGNELADIKRTIKNGQAEPDVVVDLLTEVFPVLGPEVLAYREREAAATPDTDPLEQFPEDTQTTDPGTTEPPPVTDTPGYFARGIDLGVGYFFGQRTMLVEEVNNNNPDRIRHRGIMSGVGAQVDATALAFGQQRRHALALRGIFAVGFFSSSFKLKDASGQEVKPKFPSNFVDAAGDLVYRNMLTPKFSLGAFIGAQNITLRISQTSDDGVYKNSQYTGNGYIMGRAGVDLGFRFSDAVSAGLHGGLLPTFWADNSRALGESPTSLGFMGGVRLKLNFTDTIFAQLFYAASYLRPQFPEPPGAVPGGEVRIDSAAQSSDFLNNIQGLIGMSF